MKKWMIGLVIGIIVGGGVYLLYQQRHELTQTVRSLDVPEAVEFEEIPESETELVDIIVDEVMNEETGEVVQVEATGVEVEVESLPPDSINLAVPFTPQAPHANWDLPYQEACEEASVLMAAAFLGADVDLSSANAADAEILDIVEHQMSLLGIYLDTTAEETVQFADARYPGLDFEVVANPTVDQIKGFVAAGQPVIVPAAGKQLGNPFFSGEGPLYHMLVIRGYTSTSFITNDPGTRRGEQFVYPYDTIMSAMGDWNDGDPANGAKVVITASKR